MQTALFVMLDQYADWEPAYLAGQLNQRQDWHIITASDQPTVHSIGGFTTTVDVQLTALPSIVDLVVLIGGQSWQRDLPTLTAYLKTRLTQGTIVGAICGAVDYLATRSLLTGYRHTGNAQILWQNAAAYQNPKDFEATQVVADRNLVTANGTAAIDFAKAVLKQLDLFTDQDQQTLNLQQLGYTNYCQQYGDPFKTTATKKA